MTKREYKKIIDTLQFIKDNCREHVICEECIFYDYTNDLKLCKLCSYIIPGFWHINDNLDDRRPLL